MKSEKWRLAALCAKLTTGVFVLGLSIFPASSALATHVATKGFDNFGYNYNARIFAGAADGVDRNIDGTVWGDLTYADDHLVMKWSKAWDEARFHGAQWTPDAWVTNEWNGMLLDGSETVWHYKIIWVGPQLENSPYWRDGGYPVWGEFEVIMDQGIDPAFCLPDARHCWFALVTPNGLGGP